MEKRQSGQCKVCGSPAPMRASGYHASLCRACSAADKRARRSADPDRFRKANLKYAKENPEKVKFQNFLWACRKKNPDISKNEALILFNSRKPVSTAIRKQWSKSVEGQINKELVNAIKLADRKMFCQRCKSIVVCATGAVLKTWCRECRDKDPEGWSLVVNKESHARCMANPKKHLNMVMRVAMGQCLKGQKKRRKTFDLVGYSVEDLKNHLEKQFEEDMNWENYGKLWHIDHKIPISVFNFTSTDDPDFKRAWELKNLQPMRAEENLKKSAKLEKPFQPLMLSCAQ